MTKSNRKRKRKQALKFIESGDKFLELLIYLERLKPNYEQDKELIEQLENLRSMGNSASFLITLFDIVDN
jgi:hypothetical protein